MSNHNEFISGTCQQFLFNTKGHIEGVIVKIQDQLIQVTMNTKVGAIFALSTKLGKRLHLLAVSDRSSKANEAVHPVYHFESLADAAGHPFRLRSSHLENTTVKGVVTAFHFSRHGKANGVILERGEFIHLKPHCMALSGLEVGSKVNAIGEVRKTFLGGRLLKARQVNGIDLK